MTTTPCALRWAKDIQLTMAADARNTEVIKVWGEYTVGAVAVVQPGTSIVLNLKSMERYDFLSGAPTQNFTLTEG